MPSFEEVCKKVFTDDGFALKALIGGALGFVPLLHLFVFGYFVSFAREIRETEQLRLPDWRREFRRWERLALEGLVFFIVFAIIFTVLFMTGSCLYFVQRLALPLLSGFGIFSVNMAFVRSAFDYLAYMPFALAFLLTPAVAVAALNVYLRNNDFNDYLRLDLILRLLRGGWARLVLPSFAFMGLMLLGAPLLGFAFFLGFAPIMAYTTMVFLILENANV